jgi:hypothetical protein
VNARAVEPLLQLSCVPLILNIKPNESTVSSDIRRNALFFVDSLQLNFEEGACIVNIVENILSLNVLPSLAEID